MNTTKKIIRLTLISLCLSSVSSVITVQAAKKDEPAETRQVAEKKMSWVKKLAIGAGVVLATAVGVGGIYYLSKNKSNRPPINNNNNNGSDDTLNLVDSFTFVIPYKGGEVRAKGRDIVAILGDLEVVKKLVEGETPCITEPLKLDTLDVNELCKNETFLQLYMNNVLFDKAQNENSLDIWESTLTELESFTSLEDAITFAEIKASILAEIVAKKDETNKVLSSEVNQLDILHQKQPDNKKIKDAFGQAIAKQLKALDTNFDTNKGEIDTLLEKFESLNIDSSILKTQNYSQKLNVLVNLKFPETSVTFGVSLKTIIEKHNDAEEKRLEEITELKGKVDLDEKETKRLESLVKASKEHAPFLRSYLDTRGVVSLNLTELDLADLDFIEAFMDESEREKILNIHAYSNPHLRAEKLAPLFEAFPNIQKLYVDTSMFIDEQKVENIFNSLNDTEKNNCDNYLDYLYHTNTVITKEFFKPFDQKSFSKIPEGTVIKEDSCEILKNVEIRFLGFNNKRQRLARNITKFVNPNYLIESSDNLGTHISGYENPFE